MPKVKPRPYNERHKAKFELYESGEHQKSNAEPAKTGFRKRGILNE